MKKPDNHWPGKECVKQIYDHLWEEANDITPFHELWALPVVAPVFASWAYAGDEWHSVGASGLGGQWRLSCTPRGGGYGGAAATIAAPLWLRLSVPVWWSGGGGEVVVAVVVCVCVCVFLFLSKVHAVIVSSFRLFIVSTIWFSMFLFPFYSPHVMVPSMCMSPCPSFHFQLASTSLRYPLWTLKNVWV